MYVRWLVFSRSSVKRFQNFPEPTSNSVLIAQPPNSAVLRGEGAELEHEKNGKTPTSHRTSPRSSQGMWNGV